MKAKTIPGSTALLALALATALALPAAASAAAPTISATGFSQITETTVALRGTVDDGASDSTYAFQYIALSDYEADGESFGPGTLSAPDPEGALPAHPQAKGKTQRNSTVVGEVEVIAGSLSAGQAIAGPGIPASTTIVSLDLAARQLTLSQPAFTTSAAPVTLTATGPQPLAETLEGLRPGTPYRARLTATNGAGEAAAGPTLSFATLSPPQAFGPCPNEELRSGGPHVALPPTHPSAALPDCRAYEQASPTDKNGGEAEGSEGFVIAGPSGDQISFLSNFGFPGGFGSQILPVYAAQREAPGGWSSAGLLPPASLAENATLLGWSPDFSTAYASAIRFALPYNEAALVALARDGSATRLTPYLTAPAFSFVGAGAGGATVLFEATAALPAEEGAEPIAAAVPGARNLYAWDRESGRVSLVSVLNDERSPARGGFAGPYNWGLGTDANSLGGGGGQAGSYLTDLHAVSGAGDAFFTAAGTGQLYLRLNPTQPQSNVAHPGGPDEQCTEAAKACTLHVSATHKTNGPEGGPDPAGTAPAAFMAASADGHTALFASTEKLTNDANTGPEQPPARIGAAKIGASGPEEVKESLIPTHALGTAVSPDGKYLYWAEPSLGTIARAELDSSGDVVPGSVLPAFLEPGETECEVKGRKVFEAFKGPSRPRYVAVDAGHLYWTNSGPAAARLSSGFSPVTGCGTIGRAELDSSGNLVPASVEADFIHGQSELMTNENGNPEYPSLVSNPQGIAVNSGHLYWANGYAWKANSQTSGLSQSIGRAGIDGEEVEPSWVEREYEGDYFGNAFNGVNPVGIALDETHIYVDTEQEMVPAGSVLRFPLSWAEQRSEVERVYLGQGLTPQGIALDGSHLYWADAGTGSIGRVGLGEFGIAGVCEDAAHPDCERSYLPLEGTPLGLAADPGQEHLYWSVNGEAPTNPGKDLYRFQAPGTGGCEEASGCLTDLTPDANPTDYCPGTEVPCGAQVQGVLGASKDASYVYFAADGVLAANEGAAGSHAEAGTCHTAGGLGNTRGRCNLYLAHGGQTTFIAPLLSAEGASPDTYDFSPRATAGQSRTARISPDGRALAFRSVEALTPYDNHGLPEFYLYREGRPLTCLTCNPSGEAPTAPPSLGSLNFPRGGVADSSSGLAALMTRNLSAAGERFFFETTEALIGADTNGLGGCPHEGDSSGSPPSCLDVYEWEAPGAGSCTEAAAPYSPADEGCLYLISTGKGPRSSRFADASQSGDDVFFFTPEQLVGQDKDQLTDVYDARVGGGLPAQSPLPSSMCPSVESCGGPASEAPAQASPATPGFQGPPNAKPGPPKPKCPKGKVRRKVKGKARCVKKHAKRHHRHHHRKRSHRKGRSHR